MDPFVVENGDFFSDLSYRVHVLGKNSHRNCIFSKTLSKVKIFQNAGFSSTCGRTKTELFEYEMSYIIYY